MTLTHALKWSFLAEFFSKAITPMVFIVLTRLLTPEDFGVISAALMVIAFSQILWEAGMSKALINRQTDVEDAANVAFWLNLGLGCMIATILFFVAEMVANTFFQDQRVTAVLQVMTLQVLLGAVSSVHTALLQKEMKFKNLFWVRFVTVALPGLASIPLAWNGMGYWALVAGTLVGQAFQVLMLWTMSSWRPSLAFNTSVAKEMGRFGVWAGTSGLLAWFYVWADSFIVGMYLGSHDLGLYRTGNQFAMMIFAILFGPIMPVLYSYLSRMNQDRQRLRSAIEKVIKVIIIISIPAALIIYSLSDQVGTVVFGDKWQGIGLVVGVMSLVHGFSWIIGINGEVYRAVGKPKYETIAMGVTIITYIAVYLYAIKFGFEIFIWVRFMLTLGGLTVQLYVLKIVISLPLKPIISYICFTVAGCWVIVTTVQWGLSEYLISPWLKITVGGSVSIFLVSAVILYIERKRIVKDIVTLVGM